MTALQAWQRLVESQARGRGDVDVVAAKRRRFSAKGAPKDLEVYALEAPSASRPARARNGSSSSR